MPISLRWRKGIPFITFVSRTSFSFHYSTGISKLNLVEELLNGLREGKRSSLAASITLVETQHSQKKIQAQKLLERILNENPKRMSTTFRIGLSGPPGAGKSTFIEVLGKFLTSQGQKVAVLAVDPSSATTGGSLLGDKTRMPELTRDVKAYIRPSPARGHLGGVTRSTNEAIVLCEYGGYDIIIVETVGVGQSEYAVTNMVDIFVLLLPPGGGDELQGIKRGIVERADLLVVTKADGDLAPAAHRTQYEYMAALKFMRSASPKWKTKVIQVSAKTNEGIEKFWEHVKSFRRTTSEDFFKKRGEQRTVWMWTHLQEDLRSMILQDPQLQKIIETLLLQVSEGSVSPGAASDKIIDSIRKIVNISPQTEKICN